MVSTQPSTLKFLDFFFLLAVWKTQITYRSVIVIIIILKIKHRNTCAYNYVWVP